jgi:hypothetical protein
LRRRREADERRPTDCFTRRKSPQRYRFMEVLMEGSASFWVPIFWIGLGAGALFLIDRLLLWMENAGWIYYRRARGAFRFRPNVINAAFATFDPGQAYVAEAKWRERYEASEEEGEADNDHPTRRRYRISKTRKAAALEPEGAQGASPSAASFAATRSTSAARARAAKHRRASG